MEKIISWIISAVKWTGAFFLAMMMFLTALDVACRYLFNSPIPGALELVEYMMAALIPFSVAYCAHQKSHVAVAFFLDRCPPGMRLGVLMPVKIVTLGFLLMLTYQTCLYVMETYASKLTSSVLLIAAYPFVVPMALGMGVFALILLNDLIPGQGGQK